MSGDTHNILLYGVSLGAIILFFYKARIVINCNFDKYLVISYIQKFYYGLLRTFVFKNQFLDSMQVSTQRTVRHLWLPLFMVFVLCACIISPVSWAESQQQEIELEPESKPEPSEDDKLITGLLTDLIRNDFLSLSPVFPERLSPTGSDAYPSIILHGPPAPHYPV
jgi:hypothetical protein